MPSSVGLETIELNAAWCACIAVFVWNFYCCFFCPVLVVTWCACRVSFLFYFLFFSQVYLSWKEVNILIISIYLVELYLFCFFLFMFFVLFLFGSWGCISIHEKDRGLRQHAFNYICTSLLHLVFPFPPPLIAVSECDVLWTATCAVNSLFGSVKSRF